MRRLTAFLLAAVAALVVFAGTAPSSPDAPVADGGSADGNDWD